MPKSPHHPNYVTSLWLTIGIHLSKYGLVPHPCMESYPHLWDFYLLKCIKCLVGHKTLTMARSHYLLRGPIWTVNSQASPDTPRLPCLSPSSGTGRIWTRHRSGTLLCVKNFVGSIHCLKQVVDKSSNDRRRQMFYCLPDSFFTLP